MLKVSYAHTGFFSQIILDYLEQQEVLKPFYKHSPTIQGIQQAINDRRAYNTDRALISDVLRLQYSRAETSEKVLENIELLKKENTFTICTAHQPNIFTGHLYFIYKILHAIKLADHLNEELSGNRFVPVYYMGSEDADLKELGHVNIDGIKHEWKTKQKGAVGKMLVDAPLIEITQKLIAQLAGLKFAGDVQQLLTRFFVKGTTIQEATFLFVNELFKNYGLIILLADVPELKQKMQQVFKDDLIENKPSQIVNKTAEQFPAKYKVQAQPRDINLFYFKDDLRNRFIEKGNFYVDDSLISFSREEILIELEDHPDRFSPNVILRGLYQETILPNIIFIGGGGELAYWLELKALFENYQVPFPVLLLRNSFLLINEKAKLLQEKLHFTTLDIFKQETDLLSDWVKRESKNQVYLSLEKQQIVNTYNDINKVVKNIDVTLQQHAEALQAKALNALNVLEKKMLKAEKRKFEAEQRQISKLKSLLFPHGQLQERIDNFLPYYAKHGAAFIDALYKNSAVLNDGFTIVELTAST
ncbi:MAG: bacillithiol biosynthesis cysteine-adding enzyme BshC [Ginsengibacter sp.]